MIELLQRMRREDNLDETLITPQIDNLIVIDRSVDPLTPLLSQLTYEGLIDELFGINNSWSLPIFLNWCQAALSSFCSICEASGREVCVAAVERRRWHERSNDGSC